MVTAGSLFKELVMRSLYISIIYCRSRWTHIRIISVWRHQGFHVTLQLWISGRHFGQPCLHLPLAYTAYHIECPRHFMICLFVLLWFIFIIITSMWSISPYLAVEFQWQWGKLNNACGVPIKRTVKRKGCPCYNVVMIFSIAHHWIPLINGMWCGKPFHVITSSLYSP